MGSWVLPGLSGGAAVASALNRRQHRALREQHRCASVGVQMSRLPSDLVRGRNHACAVAWERESGVRLWFGKGGFKHLV